MAQDAPISKTPFASRYGVTGVIQTADASTVGKFKGNIGVFENLRFDSLDNLVFAFGVHENIEVGIQSEIPSHRDPRMNFFFKFRGFDQGHFFGLKSKFFPSTAFGIHSRSAFAVASYDLKFLRLSTGYSFSDYTKGMFFNFSIYPIKYGAVQFEYVENTIGAGLRGVFKGVELSMIYMYNVDDQRLHGRNAFLRLGYNF